MTTSSSQMKTTQATHSEIGVYISPWCLADLSFDSSYLRSGVLLKAQAPPWKWGQASRKRRNWQLSASSLRSLLSTRILSGSSGLHHRPAASTESGRS